MLKLKFIIIPEPRRCRPIDKSLDDSLLFVVQNKLKTEMIILLIIKHILKSLPHAAMAENVKELEFTNTV